MTDKSFDELKKCIQRLESNLAFAMTLGSKELFHSNIIAWLIQHNSSSCIKLMNLFAPSCASIISVNREEKHFDLLIRFKSTDGKQCCTVIENKVKAFPDSEQLKRYNEKTAELKELKEAVVYRFLLAPQKSLELFNEQKGLSGNENWKPVSYEELLQLLPENIANDDFATLFLKSYKKMMQDLLSILDYAVKTSSQNDSLIFPPEAVLEELEKIRFADVFKKLYGSAIMHQNRCDVCNKALWLATIGYAQNSACLKWTCTRQKEGLEFGVELMTNKLAVFAQVPDGSEPVDKRINEKTLKKLFESWLAEVLPKYKLNGGLNKFKNSKTKVDGTYRYRYVKLPETFSVEQFAPVLKKLTEIIAAYTE